MNCGLLGEKLGHSFSKEIHEALGLYRYDLIELPPAQLEAFLRVKRFDGLNVTIPYKQAVIPYLDELSPRARAIGAVNTIVRRGDRLLGDNTDFGGLAALIEKMGLALGGKTVLICGTGGTSKTAAAVAGQLGAGVIYRLSRSARDGAISYEDAYQSHADAQILIHTTPAGMYPDFSGLAVDLGRLPGLQGVVDVVYNPLTTRLVYEARQRGIPAENGLYMLVAQAVLAAREFTGAALGTAEIDRIYQTQLRARRSLVLIGMPSSGKTTLGTLLEKRLRRPLIDTDAEIVRRAGMPIPQIFAQRGEAYFRDLEAQVITELSATGGRLIATGGGAILREENLRHLKQNGLLIWLDRPLEALLPTDDRPLAGSQAQLERLYRERLPRYRAAADLTLPVQGTPEETADLLAAAVQSYTNLEQK